jgi:nucleoside-diphosphate-sugar epimerase
LDFAPDVVIHAAARALPWGSKADFEAQNVAATRNVIDFCARKKTPRLIYISSSSVFYREEDQFGITENHPIGPRFLNRYAQTKYAGECLVRQYPGRRVILRPRAVFGPGDTVVFPRILEAARRGKLARLTRAGPPARGDLIYIETLCDYIMRCARDPQVEGDFNLTNNEPVEIESFLFEIFKKLNIEVPRREIPCPRALAFASGVELFYKIFRPRVEPPITRFGVATLAYSKTFDVSKALKTFGPPSVDLATGLGRFLEWQKAQMPPSLIP